MSRFAYHLSCFLFGGLYGWIGDGGHVATDVLSYSAQERFWYPGLAWWVVPQFAIGGLILSILVARVYQWTGEPGLPANFPSYAVGMAGAIGSLGTYLISSLLSSMHIDQIVISAILATLTVLLAMFLRIPFRYPMYFTLIGLITFIGGIGYESSLCHIGAFQYNHPDKGLYVNHWIGWLWVGAIWSCILPMWRYEAQARSKATIKKKEK